MYERFTDDARKVMQLANQEAQRLNHQYIGTEHILLGLLKTEAGVAIQVLRNLDIDMRKVRLEIEKIVQSGPEMVTMGKLPQTPRAKKVIEYAIEEARTLDHKTIGTEHLLLGLLREEQGVAAQVLMNLGLKQEDVREEVLNLLGQDVATGKGGEERTITKGTSQTTALDSFGRDLTELARQGKLDPVIGRAGEMEQVLAVLGCRARNHPLLVGEMGVGKTALVNGLAQRSVSAQAPEALRNRRLVTFDPAWLVILTKDKDQFEKGVTVVLSEIRRAKNVVLFLDDLHMLAGPEAASRGPYVSHLLRSALARDAIQCIGATTPEQYQAWLAADDLLGRYFQPVFVKPPSKEETVAILRGIRHLYEAHHRVQIRDEALAAAVELSDLHLPGGFFPGKAVGVLDQAGALVRLRQTPPWPDCKELDAQIEQLSQAKEAAVAEQQFTKAADLRDQADKIKKEKERLAREWRDKAQEIAGVVDEPVIAEVVRQMAGGPPGKERMSS
jgi:ATP-dependent Clp protease ATP-binding subunit ClpC